MCRNIKTLANFAPPATDAEIRASAIQFVRKLSGTNKPSRANEEAFNRAVEEVFTSARHLIDSLSTSAPPRNRQEEAEKALKDYAAQLEHVFNEVRELEKHPPAPSESVESSQQIPKGLSTAVPREVIERIADSQIELPEGFTPHPRVKPVLERRVTDITINARIDPALFKRPAP